MLTIRQLVEPVIDQAIAIVQRDQGAAIAAIDPAIAPIAAFHKGPGPRLTLPCLTVYAAGVQFDPAVENTQHWFGNVVFVLDAGNYDQDNALRLCYQYARLLHGVIESAAGPDWETPLSVTIDGAAGNTAPLTGGTLKRVFVETIEFERGEPEDRTTATARVRMTVRFEAEEN